MFKKLYFLLEIPFVYRLSQVLLKPGEKRLIGPIFRQAFDPNARTILDVGCGPSAGVAHSSGGLLVGLDINESYVRDFTGGVVDLEPDLVLAPPTGRDRLGYVGSADRLPFRDGIFDEVRSFGLFHHLTDDQSSKALGEMFRCVRSKGQLVVIDAVWPVHGWRRPLAWITRRLDRGAHMRSESQLIELMKRSCPGTWSWSRHTFTYTGLELMSFRCIKS